jgi:transposase
LPPYSPDFNPIEMAFSKLKALMRAEAERTVETLWQVFLPAECANYLKPVGHDAD